jgi:hypothetical protein
VPPFDVVETKSTLLDDQPSMRRRFMALSRAWRSLTALSICAGPRSHSQMGDMWDTTRRTRSYSPNRWQSSWLRRPPKASIESAPEPSNVIRRH